MNTRHFKALWQNRYRISHAPSRLAGEEGSVIILSLIMLVLLTLVGTSATNTSTLEVQVAGNERVYKQTFYQTDATVMQAFQWLEDQVDATTNNTKINGSDLKWDPDTPANNADFYDAGNWVDLEAELGALYADQYSLVVQTGVAAGGSLDMAASSSIYAYSVYGQHVDLVDAADKADTSDNERLIIESGYKKRF